MKSFCWNSKNKDRRYYAEDWARYFAQFIGNGVYAATATNMQVQADGGRNVRIAVGSCFIAGRAGYAEGDDVLTLDYGGGGPRIDRIVARMDVAKREIQPQIIKGEVAEEPTAPDIIRNGSYYDLCLAEITVPANATVISQADIRDTRFDDELCGVVAGVIKQISTSGFLAQYEAALNDLISKLGEDDHITIDTADRKARADIRSMSSQIPFENNFKLV